MRIMEVFWMLFQFSDRLWYIPSEEATDRPVLGYLCGDHRSLMIDAGNSARHAAGFLHLLDERNLPHPELVALTHSHWDHCYGLCALDAVSICCAATRKDLERDASLVWSDDAMHTYLETGVVQKFCEEHMRVEYPQLEEIQVNLPEIVFSGELTIDLGGCHAVLRQLTNPHTEDGVVVWLPEERVLFVGDAAYEELVGNDWIDHPDRLSSFASALREMDFTHCFVGHGEPMTRNALFDWFSQRLSV